MKRIERKICRLSALILALCLPVGGLAMAADGETTREATLEFTNWTQTQAVIPGVDLNEQAALTEDVAGYTLTVELNGYSTYDAVYMVKQEKNAELEEIELVNGGKIGTDWVCADGSELPGYDYLNENGYTDEALNECFELLVPASVDEETDTAVYNLENIDPNEKIGVIGYQTESTEEGTAITCSGAAVRVKLAAADYTSLNAKLTEANGYLSQTDVYTADSLATLQTVVNASLLTSQREDATQDELDAAIGVLVKSETTLDVYNLADGVYSVTGTMVKPSSGALSMANNAINHTVKLTVKDGKYTITLDFNGMNIGTKLGYLGTLKYFVTGYTVDSIGEPEGTLADVTVESYQTDSTGSLVSDQYGTNYPNIVSFEMIPEAKADGIVPLQVFVPIMDAISAGAGTQPVYLTLDWSTLQKTTDEDAAFTDTGDNSTTDTKNTTVKSGSTLKISTLPTSGTSSSLTSGTGKLTSGTTGTTSTLTTASSTNTGDVDGNRALWTGVLLLGVVLFAAGVMDGKWRKDRTK